MSFLDVWNEFVERSIAVNQRFRPGISLGTPKLPAYITESLAVRLINAGRLRTVLPAVVTAVLARGSGSEPDVKVTLQDGATARLEVKSTGPTTWQRASAKDAAADYFIWINLAPFVAGTGLAHVWVLPQPGRFLRAGLDWRSEREFTRLTEQHAVCLPVSIDSILLH